MSQSAAKKKRGEEVCLLVAYRGAEVWVSVAVRWLVSVARVLIVVRIPGTPDIVVVIVCCESNSQQWCRESRNKNSGKEY